MATSKEIVYLAAELVAKDAIKVSKDDRTCEFDEFSCLSINKARRLLEEYTEYRTLQDKYADIMSPVKSRNLSVQDVTGNYNGIPSKESQHLRVMLLLFFAEAFCNA